MPMNIEVFDPPLCCSTGVCGPTVDVVLSQFAADMEWFRSQGIAVSRHNLAQQPQAFVENEQVRSAMEKDPDCLPLVFIEGKIVSQKVYPTRETLAAHLGIFSAKDSESLYSPAIAELVAIGAAIAANCEPCFKYHFDKARKLGVSKEDMQKAVETAQMVKETPAKAMLELADRLLKTKVSRVVLNPSPCCPPRKTGKSSSKSCG